MKLIDLDASFVGNATPTGHHMLDSVEGAQGVLFECPKCHGHLILCWFRNPRNAPAVPDEMFPRPGRWTFSGETIETLTLSPSVDLTGPGCGWHGWVRDGETFDA